MLISLTLAAVGAALLMPSEPRPAFEVVKDLGYLSGDKADPKKHKLDLYLPADRPKAGAPLVVFVHGGSWRAGDRAMYKPLGEYLAKQGYAVAIPSYRLSPAVTHPAHVEDLTAALLWLRDHAKDHGADPSKVVLFGHSAGGHMVSLVASDPRWLEARKLPGDMIAGVVAVSGVYSIAPFAVMKAAFGDDPKVCLDASPVEHVREKMPPFLILYADSDIPLLDMMAKNFAKLLLKAKNEVVCTEIKGRSHVSILTKMADKDDPAMASILGFLKGRWTAK